MCGNPFGNGGIFNDGGEDKPVEAPPAPAPVVVAPPAPAPVIEAPVTPVVAAPTPVAEVIVPSDGSDGVAAETAKKDARRRGRASTILTGGLGDINFGSSIGTAGLQATNATYLG